jgi:[acyl-carrier-protein] S-malonyltransferase
MEMSQRTYILCPGQGAQVVGMGRDFYEKSPAAREVFDRADRVAGFDLKAICFDGPEERLNQTDVSQPAIYVTSVAAFAAARQAGIVDAETVSAYAGLSLGEYTALHLGGSIDFEDGLRLVVARGRAMQDAAVATPSGMVSVVGADESSVIRLCEENAKGEVLVPANFNAPGQVVVSGTTGACQRLATAAEGAGYKAIPLKVAGAFHSPIMHSASDRMRVELDRAELRAPRTTVFSNVTAQPHTDVASIRRLLMDQIVTPVRWEQTMHAMLAGVESRWVELAPGRVLTGLLKKINRRLAVESLATADALAQVQGGTAVR